MKKNKKIYIGIIFILSSIALFCSSPLIKTNYNNKENIASYTQDTLELKRIVDSINLIETLYVGKEDTPSKEKLYEAAVSGIVNSLNDPYSEYMNTDDLKDFESDMDGEYVGVGMSISKKKGEYLEVVSPFVGSPAEKVGIRIRDKISKVDGKDITDLSVTEASKLLRGEENTKVEVEVIRDGQSKPLTFTLTRSKIKLERVESEMLDNNIGYLSLLRFGNNVGEEVEQEVKKLLSQGMKGLILDLRMNPGGSLKEAQDVTSLFVPEDLIVSLKYKNGKETKYNRTRNYLGDIPLVVLVNHGSASASEIVTGAIKDYGRGTIIGSKTFGKGIVQQIIPLQETNDAIKLTIAQYFTPKGNYIHEIGVEPDIDIEMEEMLVIKGYANESSEARENRKKEIEEILIKDKGEEEAKKIIEAGDIQLKRAIEEISKKIN